MSDQELELHIRDCGKHMLNCYADYELSGCFGDIGAAHGRLVRMEAAISSRSAAWVAATETQRGLV